jgi:hypothetical protein
MDTISTFGFEACCRAIAGDMARALAERNGETPEQQFVRAQAAVFMIMGFLPRDVAELLLASHCVMFHELMVVGVHDALCAQDAKARRSEVQGLLAINKAFGGNLTQLQRYQKRASEGRRDTASNVAAGAVPVKTAPAATSAAAAAHVPPAAKPGAQAGPSAAGGHSADEAVPACDANPEAAAARKAGDVAGFAKAAGSEQQGAVLVAAAGTPGSPFHPGAPGRGFDGSGPARQKT